MSRITRILAVAGGLLAAQSALGQLAWKWVQPWTPPRAAHESRVRSCANPQPLTHIALDDWICGATGPIVRFTWWGTLSSPAQGGRPFYIAVYPTLATACRPNLQQPLYQVCLVPDVRRFVGFDCQNRRVYRLSAPVPAGVPVFTQSAGTHYWLQVSEPDEQSIQVNVENFRWSAHRPIRECPAVQFPPIMQPILDACDNQPNDLSFALQSRDISGTVTFPPGLLVPAVLQLDILTTDGLLRERLCVEPDDEGNYFVAPELPDGMYVLELTGGSMLPIRRNVQLVDGQCNRANFFDVFLGDLDGDHGISLGDLAQMLANFGRMAP